MKKIKEQIYEKRNTSLYWQRYLNRSNQAEMYVNDPLVAFAYITSTYLVYGIRTEMTKRFERASSVKVHY